MHEPLVPTPGSIARGAGFGIRAAARTIDIIYGLVVGLVAGLFAGIVIVFLEQAGDVAPGWQEKIGGVNLVAWGASFLGTLFYHSLTEGMYGASLGKLLCGLRVVSEAAQPIGISQAFKRSLAFYWDGLFFGVVGYLSMKESELNQRYGDHWAKTVVIKTADVPPESKRGAGMFAVAFVVASGGEMILLALGLIIPLL